MINFDLAEDTTLAIRTLLQRPLMELSGNGILAHAVFAVGEEVAVLPGLC